MKNLYNSNIDIKNNQNIYDAFNDFIFSNDRNIFNKLWARMLIYNSVEKLPGDIVECGVFKGSGLLTWLKLLNIYEPNSIKKVIGFDFFDNGFVDILNNDIDKVLMKQVFDRCESHKLEISKETIRNKILNAGFNDERFELIDGDISITSKDYIKNKPGFRISLLYMDLDLEEPTYNTLNNLWNNIVNGGIIIFDEYGYHCWSEANGVDSFVREHNLKLKTFDIKSPTAYIIK